ncbi:hypothetical protein [Asanoa iriomotensis]|uniref:HEAT repeat protein n=1 Tax=Asanoa iriomotensis TaxID=234613 RepID=A0ABQ4BX69_9ACTN|nr:hypothetical protein [Asanoa iriomotensis]GIF54761.1 hypothetical protein Air01nite_08560 [Asanoa iriomotensis]
MLIDWDSDHYREQIAAAVHGGAAGEETLLAAWADGAGDMGGFLLAALGEATGPGGQALLRRLVMDPAAEPDDRCAALVALAKRAGADASDVLGDALLDPDGDIRDYALIAMSCVGDDRAVGHVHALLAMELADPDRQRLLLAIQSLVIPMATYLLRHATTAAEQDELAALIRANRDRLGRAEREWFTVYWPAAVDESESGIHADTADMVAWQPLLRTLYPR